MAAPKLSASGWAFITGLAILANPRCLTPGSKTLVIDTQFYLGPTDKDVIVGSLRYFNSANLIFDDEPSLYAINSTFARWECMADLPFSHYTFIGDIHSLIPLGPPGPHYLAPANDSPSEGHEIYVDLNELPTFAIDPRVRPLVQVTGVAMESSKTDATFEVNVEQYVSCFKSGKQAGGSCFKPTTRFFCRIPDSPKYRNWSSKPVPGNKRYVSVCGPLTGVDRSDNTSDVEQFSIEVENVTFCGHYIQIQPSNAASTLVSQAAPAQAALFSYGAPRQSPSPSKPRKQRDQDGQD